MPERFGRFEVVQIADGVRSPLPIKECDESSKRQAEEYWDPRLGEEALDHIIKNMECIDNKNAIL